MPTWARQAWKALALQHPALCLGLLQELRAKLKEAKASGGDRKYPPLHMVRLLCCLFLQSCWGAVLSAGLAPVIMRSAGNECSKSQPPHC